MGWAEVMHSFNSTQHSGGRGCGISEFKASLVYRESSRTSRPTQGDTVSEKKKRKEKKKKSVTPTAQGITEPYIYGTLSCCQVWGNLRRRASSGLEACRGCGVEIWIQITWKPSSPVFPGLGSDLSDITLQVSWAPWSSPWQPPAASPIGYPLIVCSLLVYSTQLLLREGQGAVPDPSSEHIKPQATISLSLLRPNCQSSPFILGEIGSG